MLLTQRERCLAKQSQSMKVIAVILMSMYFPTQNEVQYRKNIYLQVVVNKVVNWLELYT